MAFFEDIIKMLRERKIDSRIFSGEERYGRIRKRRIIFSEIILILFNFILFGVSLELGICTHEFTQSWVNPPMLLWFLFSPVIFGGYFIYKMVVNPPKRIDGIDLKYYNSKNYIEDELDELIDVNDSDLSELQKYKSEVYQLKIKYQHKEEVVKRIIGERFPQPQLTYDKFMNEINEWNLIFMKEAGSILNIVDMVPSYTERVGDELQHRINILKSFVEKMDDFGVELALSRYNDDVKVRELLSDMDEVISSVKNYE